MKYVIAGSICCGKTTIINKLKELGHNVLDEIPRQIIHEEQKKENGKLPWKKDTVFDFQTMVLEKQLEEESKLDKNQIWFLDRGIYDEIGFFLKDNLFPPIDLLQKAINTKYDKIFFIETLPQKLFQNDAQRKENYSENLIIQKIIYNIYKSLNIPMIFIPNNLTTKQRINLILKNINH